jgi:hypothetical protein
LWDAAGNRVAVSDGTTQAMTGVAEIPFGTSSYAIPSSQFGTTFHATYYPLVGTRYNVRQTSLLIAPPFLTEREVLWNSFVRYRAGDLVPNAAGTTDKGYLVEPVFTASPVVFTGSAQIGNTKEIPLVIGTQTTNLGSGSKFSMGTAKLIPQNYVGANRYYFRAILAPTTGAIAYAELFDYNGVFTPNGIPSPISGSVVTGSSMTFQVYEKDVTHAFANMTGSGLVDVQIWCHPSGSSLQAICKRASIDIEW